MIISHRHKFIFIKTAKTAGTSIEIGLSKFCGPDDVITTISPEDEAQRKELGYRGPQNYRIPFSNYSKGDYLRFLQRRNRLCFYNHMGAAEIIRYTDPKVWETYFKFCFERNPWDKVVSWYFWRYKVEPRPSISDFIRSREANLIKGFELYTLSSEIVVDKVYRYERINEAVEDIRAKLDLGAQIELPKAKATWRGTHDTYKAMLSPSDRERIAQVYAREIAYFHYEW